MAEADDDKVYREAVRALVLFKVIDNNKKLLINSVNKEWLTKVKEIFEQRYPDNKYEVQDFTIRPLRKNMLGEVIKWGRGKGFSLWEKKGQLKAFSY